MFPITSPVNLQTAMRRLAALLVCCSVLAGCAGSLPNGADAKPSLESVFGAAEAELAKGKREQAVALLSDAATAYPTSIAPWLKIANVWFDAGNYPSSILAANEVLQRDPANQEAKSLLVVAGLRVAAGALSGLRPGGNIDVNVRADAENLTKSLRDVLGEKVLVPGAQADAKPVAPPRSKARITSRPPPVAASTRTGAASTAADPFKALK